MALIRHFHPGAVDTSSGLVRGVPGGGFEDVAAGGGAFTLTADTGGFTLTGQAASMAIAAALNNKSRPVISGPVFTSSTGTQLGTWRLPFFFMPCCWYPVQQRSWIS
jgi:hypothetical protein